MEKIIVQFSPCQWRVYINAMNLMLEFVVSQPKPTLD